MAKSKRHDAIVWLTESQTDLIAKVAKRAGINVIGAGSPVRGQSSAVAKALGAEPHDDLRATLARAECDVFLLAAPGDFGQRAPEDTGAILGARARNVRIATFEPIPSSALDFASAAWRPHAGADPADAVRFCALARLSRPYREATEVLQNFGPVRTLTLAAWCKPEQGSLGARLYSAMELALSLFGEAESVDAAYVSPAQTRGLTNAPGETLRNLHGDLTATLRYSDGRAATLVASDHAGRWNREITLLGPGGRLRIFDDGFEWISPDGDKIDAARPPEAKRGVKPEATRAEIALADGLARLLDKSRPDDGAPDHASILAMAQAALLSARTAQPESPGTIRRLVGAG